jgi:hypothetical protein
MNTDEWGVFVWVQYPWDPWRFGASNWHVGLTADGTDARG